jgi:hypothetical protein
VSGNDLLVGVVAGVLATVIWVVGVWLYRRHRFKHDFGSLNGRYRSTRKLGDQPEPETVSISVEENLLAVVFEGLPDGESVSGQIAMNAQLPRSGEGNYWHIKAGEQLWGFWEIQVKDADTILVHRTYASHKTHQAVVSGFVWSRVRQVSEP